MKRISLWVIIAVATFLIGIGVYAFCFLSRPLPVADIPQPPPECAAESAEEISPSSIQISERNKILSVFQESPLEQMINSDEVYRLIWFPTFDAPTVIRIWRSGENYTIKTKRLSGKGGYEIGTLKTEETRTLSAEEWNVFVNNLNSRCFWNAPSAVKEIPVMDGSSWTFEGLRNGQYHFVNRISPSNQMSEIFRHLFNLTGVKTEYELYLPIQSANN